jgi:hypothetical protein
MSTDGNDAAREADGDAPLTRREMKARGIQLTTEIPVVTTVDLAGGAGPAVHANRAGRDRVQAGRAVTETGGSAPATAGSAAETGGSGGPVAPPVTDGDGSADAPTSTGRRPVIRAPLTARGIRTVDESGEITSVQAAVGRAVESATSPASWESATALPAVALGIEDMAGHAAEAAPISPPRVDLALTETPEREPADQADAEGSTESAPGQEPTVSADGRREEPAPAEPPEATPRSPEDLSEEGAAHGPSSSPVGRLAPPRASPAPSATDRAPQPSAALEPPPRHNPRRAALRIAVILAVLVALAVLGYLLYTGAFRGGASGGGTGDVTRAAAAVTALRGLAPFRAQAPYRHVRAEHTREEPSER